MRRALALASVAGCLLAPRGSSASPPPLVALPVEQLRSLGPVAARGTLALFEQEPDGAVRQLTTVLHVAAPPEVVREVLVHPGRWAGFLRNCSRSEVEPRPDGTFRNRWRVELPIGHFDAEDEWRLAPPGEASGRVAEVRSLGEGRSGGQRWDLVAADGGGTVLANYGRYDGFDGNFVLAAMLRRNKSYGTAMALAQSLVVASGVKAEAERRARQAGPPGAVPAPSGSGLLAALLDRGVVAVIRTDAAGALIDVSVVQRTRAPLPVLLDLVRHPERWPGAIPSVKRVSLHRRDARGIDFHIVIDGVLFEVDARFRQDEVPGGADALGTSGDLAGTRFRWDLSPSAGGGGGTQAVWRGNAHLGEASRLLRALFRHEPLLEPAANVAAGVIALRALAQRARALASAEERGAPSPSAP